LQKAKIIEAYRILGVPKGSSIREATRAYRMLAKKYHPDSNPDEKSCSNTMMAKINEAYSTIKKYHECKDNISEYMEDQFVDNNVSTWRRRYENIKKQEEDRIKSEARRIRRENEALNKFWEKILNEKKYASEDKKSYDVIEKYTSILISLYYQKSFNNTIMRERPYNREAFKDFFKKYNLLMEKSLKLSNTSRSNLYKKRSKYTYEFLQCFLDDALKKYPIYIENRAQAYNIFSKTIDASDRFMYYFFSDETKYENEKVEMFRKVLDMYDYFIKSYPESPLVDYARSKLEVLEMLYRAFIKN